MSAQKIPEHFSDCLGRYLFVSKEKDIIGSIYFEKGRIRLIHNGGPAIETFPLACRYIMDEKLKIAFPFDGSMSSCYKAWNFWKVNRADPKVSDLYYLLNVVNCVQFYLWNSAKSYTDEWITGSAMSIEIKRKVDNVISALSASGGDCNEKCKELFNKCLENKALETALLEVGIEKVAIRGIVGAYQFICKSGFESLCALSKETANKGIDDTSLSEQVGQLGELFESGGTHISRGLPFFDVIAEEALERIYQIVVGCTKGIAGNVMLSARIAEVTGLPGKLAPIDKTGKLLPG